MTATRRRRPGPLVAAVVLGAAVIVIGVIAVVLHNSSNGSSGGHSIAELKTFAAKVPLPAGASLTDETSDEAHGDANSYLERDYALTSAQQSSAQIRTALSRGDCRLLDPRSGKAATIDALWSEQTGADSGDVYVLPPGTKGGGIELNWQGAKLVLRVSGGDVETSP